MASLVLFDGVCNLCNGFVRFVIERDPGGRFHFGTLQSASARRILDLHGVPDPALDSVMLVEDGTVFARSTAALRIARHLTFPWPLAAVLLAVPRPFRDWIYTLIGRRRYRWFGKREHCMIPTPEVRSRFLD
jgi:predicted DCC family thiol-disulfide oxidoreductase YuxK